MVIFHRFVSLPEGSSGYFCSHSYMSLSITHGAFHSSWLSSIVIVMLCQLISALVKPSIIGGKNYKKASYLMVKKTLVSKISTMMENAISNFYLNHGFSKAFPSFHGKNKTIVFCRFSPKKNHPLTMDLRRPPGRCPPRT